MSRLWRDRVIVGLAPGRLSALRLGGGWRKHLVAHHDQTLHSKPASDWKAALQAMQALLETPAWSEGHIEVILSNHWVHYAVIPGQPGLGAAEHKTLAGIVFANTYGDLCQDWDIRISRTTNNQSTIASGVPRGLLEALRTSAGPRLRSIRPALMSVFNRARRNAIGNSAVTLALLEHGRATVVSLEDEQWRSVVSRAVVNDDPDTFLAMLNQETALQGQTEQGPLWLCDLGGGLRATSHGTRPIHTLEPPPLPQGSGESLRIGLAQWGVK